MTFEKILSDVSSITVIRHGDDEYTVKVRGEQAHLYVDHVRKLYDCQPAFASMTFAEFLARTIDE